MLEEDVARRVLVSVRLKSAIRTLVTLRTARVVQPTAATTALRRVALFAHHNLLAMFQSLLNQSLSKTVVTPREHGANSLAPDAASAAVRPYLHGHLRGLKGRNDDSVEAPHQVQCHLLVDFVH